VQFLVTEGKANVGSSKSPDGQNPLYVACHLGFLHILKILVFEGKADVNIQDNRGGTPLKMASQNGYKDIVRFLVVESKAKVNIPNMDGCTALTSACE